MSGILYVTGDATAPQGTPPYLIAHVCSTVGAWGRGFTAALSAKWDGPERLYRLWHKTNDWNGKALCLGEVQFVSVSQSVTIANMVAQGGLPSAQNKHPLSYSGLRFCLARIGMYAQKHGKMVHMPRIGCGIARGHWQDVETLIRQELCDKGVGVTVYDL